MRTSEKILETIELMAYAPIFGILFIVCFLGLCLFLLLGVILCIVDEFRFCTR